MQPRFSGLLRSVGARGQFVFENVNVCGNEYVYAIENENANNFVIENENAYEIENGVESARNGYFGTQTQGLMAASVRPVRTSGGVSSRDQYSSASAADQKLRGRAPSSASMRS